MNILSVDYSLRTGSLDIYVAGCSPPHCHQCHNPDSWDFNEGVNIERVKPLIETKVRAFECMIANFMIFGGEPLDQPAEEFADFLEFLTKFSLPIWIFTRYDISEIPDNVKGVVDYIKTGRYIPDLTCEGHVQYGIELATSNQKIYKKDVDF
ncbi:MAG: hypothetical protein KQ78_01496 [Candidatus Izimaplasma bacterium HR2]|nr:MAG: hypothetical protein KQ78_01496 [Candidatus Izimaplasma bacterium HR2]